MPRSDVREALHQFGISLASPLQTVPPIKLPAGHVRREVLFSGMPSSSEMATTTGSAGHEQTAVENAARGGDNTLSESTRNECMATSQSDIRNTWSGALFMWPKRRSFTGVPGSRAMSGGSKEKGADFFVDTEADDWAMTADRTDAEDDVTETKTVILASGAGGEAKAPTITCIRCGLKGGEGGERQLQNWDMSSAPEGAPQPTSGIGNDQKSSLVDVRRSTTSFCVPCTQTSDREPEDNDNDCESALASDSLSVRQVEGKKSGFLWTGAVILKSSIGGGFLFLPHVFMRGGLVLSFIMFSLVFAAALYCMVLLIHCCKPGVRDTYEGLAERTHGKWARRMVEFCIIVSHLAFSTVNIVLVAGNMRDVIWAATDCDPNFEIPTRVLLWAGAVVYMPLCLLRHMKYLAPVAFVASVGTCVGIVMLLASLGLELATRKEPSQITLFNWQHFPLVLGTVIYMWEGTGLVLPIRENATQKVQANFPRVLSICLGALFTTYTSFVLCANFTFGNHVEPVVLSNLPANILGLGVQAVFAFAIATSVPLMIFPASAIVEHWFLSRFKFRSSTSTVAIYSIVRICLVIIILAAATVGLQQIDNFVALIGGACGAPLTFVFPTLIHIKLHPDEAKRWKLFHYFIICSGVGVQVFSIYWTVASWRGINEFAARCSG
ncbi:transmembrane amino acid transporter protein [Toxoplasma gondii MAS]|uniref:Transmembrane amino acid transporter protein n=1 Tax=Toxoplasma gondii MAS TaxID=943118 RepID=A0A086QCK9_TOXGO|nr:transmembrane amino acid transporter protein [Toxoplasma gondii MAS]